MTLHRGLVAFGDRQVPHSVIASAGLEPEATAAALTALECVLEALKLTDRTDRLTMIVASKLIELARAGERDPQRLCDLTLDAIQAGGRTPLTSMH
jgi:hypothetical protein